MKSEAFSTFCQPITTQHTQMLLKFDQQRKDTSNYNFFNYERWAQHVDIRKCLLSIISFNIFKNCSISFIQLKDMSVFVCCISKYFCCCFLLSFQLTTIELMCYNYINTRYRLGVLLCINCGGITCCINCIINGKVNYDYGVKNYGIMVVLNTIFKAVLKLLMIRI